MLHILWRFGPNWFISCLCLLRRTICCLPKGNSLNYGHVTGKGRTISIWKTLHVEANLETLQIEIPEFKPWWSLCQNLIGWRYVTRSVEIPLPISFVVLESGYKPRRKIGPYTVLKKQRWSSDFNESFFPFLQQGGASTDFWFGKVGVDSVCNIWSPSSKQL